MKLALVSALAGLGMIVTGGSVYLLTPAGGLGATAEARPAELLGASREEGASHEQAVGSEMSAGTTLRVEGRVGHTALGRAMAGVGETFVLLEIKAAEGVGQARPPVNLSLVVDRSGSMKGTRLRNAVTGALSAVDRLSDGDVVSVVAFDAESSVVVPPTVIDRSSIGRIRGGIQGITLGGDTCISCGIEMGLIELKRTSGRVNRMIVLSDGEATAGVRDLPGFRSIAQRAGGQGTSITTIGVDVGYNERILSAIALDSNGRHHFVANDADLGAAFGAEARSLTRVVASSVEATIELPRGVELVRVVDRAFRRDENKVSFPLGAMSAGEVQSILIQVYVPADREGPITVAGVDLAFRDHMTNSDGRVQGRLATVISASGASALDSLVEARVNRTATADALKDASALFKQGKLDEARRRLGEQKRAVLAVAATANDKAPAPIAAQAGRDFSAQQAALENAERGFATPPSDPFQARKGQEAVKQQAADELELRR